jgi:predicted nucleic acid-binding protein
VPHYFFLDTSALVKHYHTEAGTAIVQRIFDALKVEESSRIAISSLIISEAVSVINRKYNRGEISLETARAAQASLIKESRRMIMGPLDDLIVYQSMSYVTRYNLNASDALYLYQCIWLQHVLRLQDETNDMILVTADGNLLRAARSEGLLTVNPETATADDALTLLGV